MTKPDHEIIPGFRGYTLNRPEAAEFVEAIGKLLLNFGSIELASIVWVGALTDEEFLVDVAIDMKLSQRIELLLKLIHRETMPTEWVAGSKHHWKQVRKLSEIRNTVAHGPVVFAWKGEPTDGPSDILGVASGRHAKSNYGGKLPTVGIDSLKAAVDAVAKTALEIQKLFEELRASRPREGESQ